MEAIGDYIIDLYWASMAKMLHNFFVGTLTAIMTMVSKMIVDLWDDEIINAIVSCTSWVAMGVFAIGCILMLYDILEARSEEKTVYMSAVSKNFLAGAAFAAFGPKTVHMLTKAILSLLQLLKISDAVTSFNGIIESLTDTISPSAEFTGSIFWGLLVILITLIGSTVFIYKGTLRFVQFLTVIIMVPLYEVSIVRGDQTAFSGWFRQAMAVGLTFFFEYFLYALGISMLAAGGVSTSFLGFACLMGLGSVSRTMDKYGMSSAGPHINPTGVAYFAGAVKGLMK